MFRKTLVLTLLIALLAACAPAAQSTPVVEPVSTEILATEAPATEAVAEGLTFTDGLGREVTLAAPAQRIVTLAPSLTEFVFAVGAGSQLVGRDELADFPAEAANVASIGSAFGDLNTEAILALEPDLVLAAGINTPEQVQELEGLGLTVYYLANSLTYDELYEQVNLFGQLTGHEEEAAALAESLAARVEAVESVVATATEKPTVFYEIDGTDPAKPWTTGPGTFMDTMITKAGGVNIGGVLSDSFAQISVEEIVAQDPNIIILGDTLYGVTIESIGERTGWGDLTAVKEGNIFAFDDNLASRPGPRLVDGLEELLKILHPELVVSQ
ncbi:MAG: ABC transporter substrate-binding protein [Chloroflexi bacterium]|nr:ABC transporter substrate-binding protein [Chloroflexota bacterium]MBI3170021.1 ABC transporter substrate-binding protein [Chloroflexota bacterium]